MTGQQHAMVGIGVSLPAGVALAAGMAGWAEALHGLGQPAASVGVAALVAGGGLVGALLPDLDTERSLLESAPRTALRRLWRGGWGLLLLPVAPILIVLALALWLVNEVIMRLTDHRSATHSLTALVLLTLGTQAATGWMVGPALTAGLAIGYSSHLAADALTPRGVELAAPWSRRRWHLLPRPLRFGGDSLRAGCLASAALAAGLAATAWQVWRIASGG
jgi:inner membrane protein